MAGGTLAILGGSVLFPPRPSHTLLYVLFCAKCVTLVGPSRLLGVTNDGASLSATVGKPGRPGRSSAAGGNDPRGHRPVVLLQPRSIVLRARHPRRGPEHGGPNPAVHGPDAEPARVHRRRPRSTALHHRS